MDYVIIRRNLRFVSGTIMKHKIYSRFAIKNTSANKSCPGESWNIQTRSRRSDSCPLMEADREIQRSAGLSKRPPGEGPAGPRDGIRAGDASKSSFVRFPQRNNRDSFNNSPDVASNAGGECFLGRVILNSCKSRRPCRKK